MNRKTIFIIVGVIALALIIFLIYKNKDILFAKKSGEVDKTPISGNQVDTNITIANFPLKYGSKGMEVTNLQKAFNRIAATFGPIDLLTEDGIFGPKTEYAVTLMFKGSKVVTKEDYVKYVLPVLK